MKIPIRKIITWSAIILTVFIFYKLAGVRSLIYPYSQFPHQKAFPHFTVYSDEPLPVSITALMDTVRQQVHALEAYDPDASFNIFFCNSPTLYGEIVQQIGRGVNSQGIYIAPLGNVFINLGFIERIRQRYGPDYRHTMLEGRVIHIVVHELAHGYIARKVGFWQYRRLPFWKQEGYAEYAAAFAETADFDKRDFLKRVSKLVDSTYLTDVPIRRAYFRSQLLVEFFLTHQGNNLNDLLDASTREDAVEKELMQWFQENSDK